MRQIAGTDVFPIGLGGMPMSLSGRPPEERSIRTIHAALDAGVNVIDTADGPFPPGDLVLDVAGLCVDQVEVLPAVTFGGVEDLVGRVEVMDPDAGNLVGLRGVGGPSPHTRTHRA